MRMLISVLRAGGGVWVEGSQLAVLGEPRPHQLRGCSSSRPGACGDWAGAQHSERGPTSDGCADSDGRGQGHGVWGPLRSGAGPRAA